MEFWGKETPGLFGDFYEQPLLNYFVQSMTQRGEIKVPCQICNTYGGIMAKEELKQDCADSIGISPQKSGVPG